MFDGEGQAECIVAGACDATLEGVSITGADGDGDLGGAVLAEGVTGFALSRCRFDGNACASSGGAAVRCRSSGVSVDGCVFLANDAEAGGGALNAYQCAPVSIRNCVFAGNTTDADGGAVRASSSTMEIVNCAFSGNVAGTTGGALSCNDAAVTVVNCTFASNSGSQGGAISAASASTVDVTNAILWGDTAPETEAVSSSLTITYSDVAGGLTGAGVIDADPLFVDADGPDDLVGTVDDDLRLQDYSPCIDAADGDVAPPADADGSPRCRHCDMPAVGTGSPYYVDMGAYEFQDVPECAGDDGGCAPVSGRAGRARPGPLLVLAVAALLWRCLAGRRRTAGVSRTYP